MNIKSQVKEFIKEYKLNIDEFSSKHIEEIIAEQGYKVIRFGENQGKSTDDIIKLLNLIEECNLHKAFTYSKADLKFIFVSENITSAEYFDILLHEEAHIYLRQEVSI